MLDLYTEEDYEHFQETMAQDCESAYLAIKKVIQSDEHLEEIAKTWAWAYDQEYEHAWDLADKMGLNKMHAFAVLENEKDYFRLYQKKFLGLS